MLITLVIISIIFIIIISFIAIFFVVDIIRSRVEKRRNEIWHSKNIISFKKGLPFIPLYQQVIYFEFETNPILNNFIETNYYKIQYLFALKGFSFFYLGHFIDKLKDPEFYSYNFPGLMFDDKLVKTNEFSYSGLLGYLNPNINFKNGLIRYKSEEEHEYQFLYYDLKDTEIWEQLNNYESLYSNGPAAYSLIKDPEKVDDKADYYFNIQSNTLIDEIKERVEKLRIIGIEEMYLKSLFEFKPKLSKIVITKDFKILLPDYKLEIIMHPLPKAVYFLFLNHPEGILFKHLPTYRKELLDIYKNITSRIDIDDVKVSINDITDPTKNAINEKCSRIRSSFLEVISEYLAKNYYITGSRGESKKIILERDLVEFK